MRRIARDLVDAEVPFGDARDLRQVRDRDHLRRLGGPHERARDGVGRLAADARVELVEDERVAAGDDCDRERDPRELAAGRRLRDRRERQARVRADQELDLVGAGRAGLALSQARLELAVAETEAFELGGDRFAEARCRLCTQLVQAVRQLADACLGRGERLRGDVGRIDAGVERGELRVRIRRTSEQLVVGLSTEASPRVGDALKPALDLLQPARLRAERGEERAQLRRRLAEPELDVTQLVAGARELGRERLERRDRALGARREGRGAVAVLGCERLCRGGRAGDELFESKQPLALRTQILFGAGLEAFRRLDERAQLLDPLGRARRAFEQLLVTSPRGAQLAPRRPELAAQLAGARERVEHVELERRPREPPLLELPGHRDRALRGRGHVLARRRSAPRVRARAPVAEDPARDDERVLAGGLELGERFPRLGVELGLDVRLVAGRPDHGGVRAAAEQKADRLGEDRLACAGLARDRVQAGSELELGLADQDEVLDTQASQHAAIVA